MNKFRYPSFVPERIVTKYLSSTDGWGHVEEIAYYPESLASNSVLRWLGSYFKRADGFKTYFRAPLASTYTSRDKITIYFTFIHSFGTEYFINEGNLKIPNLKFHDKICMNNTHFMDVYKMTCLPGTVIPIQVVVLGAGEDKSFKLEWTLSPDYESRQPLAKHLVSMGDPEAELFSPPHRESVVPILAFDPEVYDELPLYGPWPACILERFVAQPTENEHYLLEGYFRFDAMSPMLVLSSTTSVCADIYQARREDDYLSDLFHLFTFKAGDGFASKAKMNLGHGVLYKIEIRGEYVRNKADFTLMAHNPDNKCEPTLVNLLVPKEGLQQSIFVGAGIKED